MLCYVMSCYSLLFCSVMSCYYVMLCYVMSCHVCIYVSYVYIYIILYYIILCYIILYYVILYYIIFKRTHYTCVHMTRTHTHIHTPLCMYIYIHICIYIYTCDQGNPRFVFSQKMPQSNVVMPCPFGLPLHRSVNTGSLCTCLCFEEAQGISKGAPYVLSTRFPSGLCTSSTMPLRTTLFLYVHAENCSMGSKIPLDLCCS